MLDLFANTFPLDAKINPSIAGVFENGRKNWFPLARKSVSTNQNEGLFVRINLREAEKSFNCQEYLKSRKKWFILARKSVSTSRNKFIFQILDFPYGFQWRKKSQNKRILFQVDRKSSSTSRNGEFV